MVRPMSPSQTAKINLCDYIAQVESRVIDTFQDTPELPAGTRQFRAVVWHRGDDKEVDHGAWTKCRCDAFEEAESLLSDLEDALEKAAELEAAA
jgi:hypothetical protein